MTLLDIEIRDGLSSLPDRELAVLVLMLDGYFQNEITTVLGISRTTVWQDQQRAIKRLQEVC
jgi:DNA-directed RNA polymerase specialized sigma24 family protein